MFIRRTIKRVKGKTYFNHLLVESVATPKGPRQRTICSLGSLAPAPRKHWLTLAHKVESALSGQPELLPDKQADAVLATVKAQAISQGASLSASGPSTLQNDAGFVSIDIDRVEVCEAREAGPVHVGHQMWKRLQLDQILTRAGLSRSARQVTEAMVLNRLVKPLSEHAMPGWIRRVALSDIVGVDFETLNHHVLYRNLDRLHPQRALIEKQLAAVETDLFNLDETIYLYDITSTYFEGLCPRNPQAKRGYSRDKRPDCKQVLVGLVINRDGFPKAHEVFEGNRRDHKTIDDMLDALENRTGKHEGLTVVVDRGMAYPENLRQIKARGYHYIVAARQVERLEYLEEFEDEGEWEEVIRKPSPTNPAQKKSRVFIKRKVHETEVHILCVSDGRKEKDRAIREKHEERLVKDLKRLEERVSTGQLVDDAKIHEAIGRLKERYPRVARYYKITYDAGARRLSFEQDGERRQKAEKLDGAYILKTDRQDLTADDIWRTYILLTRVEAAFRTLKSPLAERPIFHHLEHRVQTHIFLCVLAYHLVVSTEKTFLDRGIHTSWDTLRQQLATHQVVTVVLPTTDGEIVKIRRGTTPEEVHKEIYRTLAISHEVMKPVTTRSKDSDGTESQVVENQEAPVQE
jgi:transposase